MPDSPGKSALRRLRVAVLIGGRSRERPGSIRTARAVLDVLQRSGHNAFEVDPSDDRLVEQLWGVDCVFNGLHGRYGEDGKIQGLLESLSIPYTGCGVLASALGMHKPSFKRIIRNAGIPTPAFIVPRHALASKQAVEVLEHLRLPVVVKPSSEGGSLGVAVAHSAHELEAALRSTAETFGELFVEEFVDGDFVTVGVLGTQKRPERVLPPLRVVVDRRQGEFYTERLKHTKGLVQYDVPARLEASVNAALESYAREVFQLLGCHGAIRIDAMIARNGDAYVIEVNTLPGLSAMGNLTACAAADGLQYEELVEWILASAFNRSQYEP